MFCLAAWARPLSHAERSFISVANMAFREADIGFAKLCAIAMSRLWGLENVHWTQESRRCLPNQTSPLRK
jgi:hypothetical protein